VPLSLSPSPSLCHRSVQAGIHVLSVRSVRVEIGSAGGSAVEYNYADLELARKVWGWCCQILGLAESQLPLPPCTHLPYAESPPAVTPGGVAVKFERDGDTATAGERVRACVHVSACLCECAESEAEEDIIMAGVCVCLCLCLSLSVSVAMYRTEPRTPDMAPPPTPAKLIKTELEALPSPLHS
jgi:hypothetical protein